MRGLVLLLALLAGPVARAEPVTWVTSAPPVPHSRETQDSGELAFLTAHLSQFSHSIVAVSTARAYYELDHGPSVCKVGVMVTADRQKTLVFASRRMFLPGYRLVVRKDRMAAMAPAIAKGEIDLEKLGALPGFKGGYTHLRHFDAPITSFIQAHEGSSVDSVVATELLFNLMQAERMDYAFVLPQDLSFYADEAARQKLVLLPVKGGVSTLEAGVACSTDASGKRVIRAVDLLLADDQHWADFVAPLRKWLPPEAFPTLLSGKPSNMDRVP